MIYIVDTETLKVWGITRAPAKARKMILKLKKEGTIAEAHGTLVNLVGEKDE